MHILQWAKLHQAGLPPSQMKLAFDSFDDLKDYVNRERIKEFQYIYIQKYSTVQVVGQS
jgi:hypothetical protein